MIKKTILMCMSALYLQASDYNTLQQNAAHLGFQRLTRAQLENSLLFGGLERYNPQIVDGMREIDLSKLKKTKEIQNIHNEKINTSLDRLIGELTETLGEMPSVLEHEIAFKKSANTITFIDYLFLPARWMAATHTPNPREAEFFSAFAKKTYNNLTKGNSWKDLFFFAGMMSAGTTLTTQSSFGYKKAEDLLTNSFPLPVYMPIVGYSEVGFAFLIAGFLNHTFPIGIKQNPGRAHSIDFTPIGFSFHDYLHARGSSSKILFTHIQENIGAYVKKGYTADEVSQLYIPFALKVFNLQKKYLLQTLEAIIHKNDIKSLVAYFYLVHEYNQLSNNYYQLEETSDFSSLINGMCNNAKKIIQSAKIESDFLESNPITGDTNISDEALIKKSLETSSTLKFSELTPEQIEKEVDRLYSLVHKFNIERHDIFISVRNIELRNGQQIVKNNIFPTLKGHLFNAEDHLKLLKIAGVEIPSLDLSETNPLDENRNFTLDHLNTVNSLIVELINHFQRSISGLFLDGFTNEAYNTEHDAIKTDFQERLQLLDKRSDLVTTSESTTITTTMAL